MSLFSILLLALAGVVIGGIIAVVREVRKPDPNPNGLLSKKDGPQFEISDRS